jgi:hypothetical protein
MYEAEVSVKNSEDFSLFSPVVNPLSDPLVSISSEEFSRSPQELTAGPLATIPGPVTFSSASAISSPATEDITPVRSTTIIQDLLCSPQPVSSQCDLMSLGLEPVANLVQSSPPLPPLKKPRTFFAECHQFTRTGHCVKGNSCDFAHMLRDTKVTHPVRNSTAGTHDTSEQKEAEALLKLRQARQSKARALQLEFLRANKTVPLPTPLEPIVHVGFFCAYGCSLSPITGARYTCKICPSIHFCSTCEKRDIHNPEHPLIKYRSVQVEVSPRVSTVMSPSNLDILTAPSMSSSSSSSHSSLYPLPGSSSFSFASSSRDVLSAGNFSSPASSSFSSDSLRKDIWIPPSISSPSSSSHSSLYPLPVSSSSPFDSSSRDFLDMSRYVSPTTSISTDHLSLLDTNTFLTEAYSAPIDFDKILTLSKEASRRSFLDMKGSMSIVESLYNSGLPLINRAKITCINMLMEIQKHYQTLARLSKRKRDGNFPRATSLRVPAFQYQKNVDHTTDNNNVTSIIRNANMALMDVALSSTSKDMSRAIDIVKSAHLSSARSLFNSLFLPSAPLFLLFGSIDTNTLKINRMLAFFRLYDFLTSTLGSVNVPEGSVSKDRSIMPISVLKDPNRLNA